MIKKSHWVPAFAGMTALLMSALSVFALASDGTVSKSARERFLLYDAYGNPRTSATLSRFSAVAWKDGARTPLAGAFRNMTSLYEFSWSPMSAGEYAGYFNYSGVPVAYWRRTVRADDLDTFRADWTAARAGYMDKLDVSGTLAHSDAAGTYKADVGALALDANAQGHVTAALAAYDGPTKAEMDAAILANNTSMDNTLTASHGTGLWSAAGSVAVTPFQGTVSYETASRGADVHVVRGDSVNIPYSLGTDLTGWQVFFGAKANPADSGYAAGLKDITAYVTDAQTGSGLISLTSAETDVAARRYHAEIEIRKAGELLTPLRFFLWVDADVIR